METQHFIWFLCFLSAATSFSFQNIRSNLVDRSVRLGQFVNIEPEVEIEAGSTVGSFAKVAANTHIGKNSRVGSFALIGERCNVANNVNIGSNAKLANQVVIGSNSLLDAFSTVKIGAIIGNDAKLGTFSTVGRNAQIGNRVELHGYSAVGSNGKIGDDSILNKFSRVGDNAELSSKAYVGQYSHVAPQITVGELAVIHNFVETESGANIKPKQVVIRTPSSFDLYQQYALNVPAEKVLPEPNSMLLQTIETELNSLRTSCSQGGIGQTRPTSLPEIVSMYLIQYHGLQRYNEIKQLFRPLNGIHSISIINSQVLINGNRYVQVDSSLLWQLQNEYHFGKDSPNNILAPDVKQKLIQLLAIDQDAQRRQRVEFDTFCKMVQEILNGDRDVTCAKPVFKSLTIIFN